MYRDISDLYEKLNDELIGWCRYMTGDLYEAQELVQEGFLRAMKYEDTLKSMDEARQRAWMYQTIKHLFIDRTRKKKHENLTVAGPVRIDRACVDMFKQINATCEKLVVIDGHTITDQAFATIDRETLENHPEGVSISDVAMLNVSPDIPPALIRERLKISDCAKISCSEQQKAAISEVSTDVAMIGSGVLRNVFGALFGGVGNGEEGNYGDTKYINADYYEL